MSNVIIRLLAVALFSLLAACAPSHRMAAPDALSARGVETLNSSLNIAVKTSEGSVGGHGYLVYKSPDRFHLVILSPFGLTLAEMFVAGERVTCIVPSKGAAYTGMLSEVPDGSPLRSWGIVRWAVSGGWTDVRSKETPLERETADGGVEVAYFDGKGLLQRKVSEGGDELAFGDYRFAAGVPFPALMEFTAWNDDTVTLTFDDPEINAPVEEGALTPALEGLMQLPVSQFKGL